ncbi:MAG: SUMF1/EgtB/PvdO family nonheme iron enzyme [Prevotella sp.]|nr:SUMF1/EgtB/PvdO family nonheme iron enzyme [Prevotella sp.]
MKRLTTIFFSLLCALVIEAQSLAVQSFRLDETDLTANTPGTIVMDQNGLKCALIKVETTQTGFSFDAGSLGVVKTEQKVGEIWVYVPEGVKRLTISHQQLGVLRDYDLGQMLRRAKTYILKLSSGEVQTIVKQSRTSQYVVFQMTPPNAVVMLDNEMLSTVDGVATKMMKFGTYDYRVQAPDYLPEVGKVTVNDPRNKHVVNIKLKPNFSQVTLTVDNNAEIWVNGQKKGEGSWTGNLGAGTYEFETRKAGHRPATTSRDIAVTSTPQTIRLNAPTPIYGEADINSQPAMADIYIDGKKYGQTPQLVDQLLIGQHQIRLSRQGYADYTGSLAIREGDTTPFSVTLKRQEERSSAANVASSSAGSGADRRTVTVGGVQFTMVRVDGGTFQMGATSEQGSDAYSDEKPAHQVTLSSYYIGETEVTQELWRAVMGENPSNFKGDRLPVESVSWKDCQSFIEKLNRQTGLRFRLPTEAEWEYAARGGNKSRGYKYSGSNNIGDVAWYNGNSSSSTHDVKTKQPNELGLYDMSGNVWEWCQDWYGSYNAGSQQNPTGASSGSNRVSRGGSWSLNARNGRVSVRYFYAPDFRNDYLGLRLVLQ